MNEETRLNFARLHMGALLPLTPWVTLSECLQASPSVLHGREVVECMSPFGAAVMGIDRNALQALVEGDIDAYEEEAWYEKLREDIKADRQSYMGEDGEVRIPPRCVTVPVPNDAVLVVTRARVVATAPSGRRMPGCCEVFWPERGETLFALREELITAW